MVIVEIKSNFILMTFIGSCLNQPYKRQRTGYDSERTMGSENVHSSYKVNIIHVHVFAFLAFEPHHEKTGFLPMRKLRHRSASQ